VGGIGAGIIAVAVTGFAVAFFFVSVSDSQNLLLLLNPSRQRRARKRKVDDAARFDVRSFRRSAVMLPDPPTPGHVVSDGYNPPPMMQRNHETSLPASPWAYSGSNTAGNGIHSQYQDVSDNILSSAPQAEAFVIPSGPHFQQNLPSPHGQSASDSPVLTRHPSNNLTRKKTNSPVGGPRQIFTTLHTTRNAPILADDYVDLSRSSVSPFQAAQYAEISRRLNHTSSTLSTIISPAQIYAIQQKELPPVPTVTPAREPAIPVVDSIRASPFDDQEPSSPPPPQENLEAKAVAASVAPPANEPMPLSFAGASTTLTIANEVPTLSVQTMHLAAYSSDSSSQEVFEFPVPPSPAISYFSRYRTDSLPHVLPEINIQERSSVSSYIPGSSAFSSSGYISGMMGASEGRIPPVGLPPLGLKAEGRFVYAPSPLASSFAVSTPAMKEHEGRSTGAQASTLRNGRLDAVDFRGKGVVASASSVSVELRNSELKRPETVYNPDDVYGGI